MGKVCPFMSRNIVVPVNQTIRSAFGQTIKAVQTLQFVKVNCLEEDCRAWQPPTYFCKMSSICPRVDMEGCNMDTCPDAKKAVYTPGFCALIP